jgi:hypothetical protein
LWISHHIVKYKNEIREKAVQLRIKAKVNMRRGTKYAFFISHHQATGGDQCHNMCFEFERLGFPCWYDQTAEKIDKRAMAQGVAQSECMILFLSSGEHGCGVLGRSVIVVTYIPYRHIFIHDHLCACVCRPYCHFEVREAMKHRKKIILCHETDDRHG